MAGASRGPIPGNNLTISMEAAATTPSLAMVVGAMAGEGQHRQAVLDLNTINNKKITTTVT